MDSLASRQRYPHPLALVFLISAQTFVTLSLYRLVPAVAHCLHRPGFPALCLAATCPKLLSSAASTLLCLLRVCVHFIWPRLVPRLPVTVGCHGSTVVVALRLRRVAAELAWLRRHTVYTVHWYIFGLLYGPDDGGMLRRGTGRLPIRG
jgi:hypothetical protein